MHLADQKAWLATLKHRDLVTLRPLAPPVTEPAIAPDEDIAALASLQF
ncbi:hypothetical protein [Methylorubrum thiocyanatum]